MATMPSASLVSTSASNSTTVSSKEIMENNQNPMDTPLGLAIQTLEKKVRNLEKRKVKLDGYRADDQRGKPLNDDQKFAISKYDEVIQNLEFARDLANQFKNLSADEEKNKKKILKKEQIERAKAESQRLAQILEIQDILSKFSKAKVRSDFSEGNHNAIKLSNDQLSMIDEFSISVLREMNSPDYEKSLSGAAENLLCLVEGKSKKIGSSNFKDLKSLLESIKSCGYFQSQILDEDEKASTARKESVNGERKEATPAPAKEIEQPPVIEDHVAKQQPRHPSPTQHEPTHPPQPTELQHREAFISQHPTPPQPAQQIDFFQDSQIEIQSPHMDPAVVMVQNSPPPQHFMPIMTLHQTPGIPTQTFTNQMFVPTTLGALQQQHEQMMFSNQQQLPHPVQEPSQQYEYHNQHQDEENLTKRMGQVGIVNHDGDFQDQKEMKDHGFERHADPMANIDSWENEEATGNGHSEESRSGSHRGGNRGRGRGGFRGERRGGGGGYRGGREHRDGDGGYRGRGRGSDRPRGERRDREYRRGGGPGQRGGRGGQRSNGYQE